MTEILVIGAGEYGLTTALELARTSYRDKADKILVIDRYANPPAPDAACYDINKIIRGADDRDPILSDLGIASINKWYSDPEWSPYFTQSGIVVASSTSEGLGYDSVTKTFKHGQQLHIAGKTSHAPIRLDTQNVYEDTMSSVSPFKVGTLPPFAFYNATSGWADSTNAMRALAKRCVDAGVRFDVGQVNQLIIEDGDVRGVETDDGRQIWASELVVLAAGSWTPAILPELQNKIKATGQVIAKVQLSPEEVEIYKNAPVYLDYQTCFYVFPPNSEGIVKFAIHAVGFDNDSPSLANTARVSVPRTKYFRGSMEDQIPKSALKALRVELAKVWPELAKKKIVETRMCWYCDTVDEHFLISYHDKYPSLFLATGGSGKAFKYAPILGSLIVQGIEGTLSPQLADTWSFTRDRGHPLMRDPNTAVKGPLDVSTFADADDLDGN